VLVAAGVEGWAEVPLWLPEAEAPALWHVDATRAHAAGLRCRPVADTVADVWTWLRDGGEQALTGWHAEKRAPGLTPAREAELLARLDG
jgi:2'-hydroxyisoflavone reductase